MKNFHEKSMRALQLAGLSKETQRVYTRAVRQLVDFHGGKTPDQMTEREIEDYFLHQRNVNQ